MAALPELEQFDVDIFQIETDSVWLGGVDGLANNQGKALANRTKWLKAQLLAALASLSDHEAAADPHPQYATDVSVAAQLNALLDGTPGALDTLNELAAALGDDPNFAATIVNALALKAALASPIFTGDPRAPTPAQFDNDTSLVTSAFVQRALGNSRAIEQIVANTVLTAEDAGKVYHCAGAGGFTITLPAVGGAPSGAKFEIMNNGSANVTINRAGADNIIVNNGAAVSSLTLGKGDSIVLTSQVAQWVATSGSGQLKYTDIFAATLAASGYQKLPSGLIIQWGQVTTSGSADVTASFPIAFPTAALRIALSPVCVSGLNSPGYNTLTSSNVKLNAWSAASSRSVTQVDYVVIGY